MPFFKKKKKEKTAVTDASKRLPPDMVYSMEPRHGHAQDVVDENNVRQVAGCLPIDPVNKRFLLVTSSSNPGNWVIPKGGWEKDETQQQAAMRETWEEAGIKGVITRHIGVFAEKNKGVAKAHHWIYEMEIIEVTKKFPEQKKRERRWFTYEEARLVVKASFILDALSMSSLSPLSHPDCDSLQTTEKKKEKKKKKKPVSDEEESEEEDAEEKKRKKERKKEKKREKKERKLKEAEEGELSDVDENGIVLNNDQKLQRRRTRIDAAKAALQEETDTDNEDVEEKKKKKKKGKKGEISELQEQDMLFSANAPLGKFDVTPTNGEERYEPIVQQLQQTHISTPPIQQQRSVYPQQTLPPHTAPHHQPQPQPRSPPHHSPQQSLPHMSPPLMRPSQQGPNYQQQRPPQFSQQQQHPNYLNNPQRPMYNPQQQQRQPLFPPQGPNPQIRQYPQQPGSPGQQQRPMHPQQQQQQQQQGAMYPQRPSNHYAQVRQGKHHVVEDSF